MSYVLTLDVGTTSLKSTVFDSDGRMVSAHLEEYALDKPCPDWLEVEAEVYWQSALKGICAVLSAARLEPADIRSIGVTSQGETLIVLDRDGRPLRKAIVWLDNRSRAEADALGSELSLEEIYCRTGQQEMVPTWTATRIAWLRGNEPETFRKAHKFLLVEDYLIYRLTGCYATDRGLNSSTLYYDLTVGDWWPEMLELLGIDREQLPELKTSGEIVGTLTPAAASETGLRREAIVTTAPIDQIAATIGAGNLDSGVVTECTGAALALCATVDHPMYDPRKRIGLNVHAIPGRYVLMPWVPTAGMVLRWFRDTFTVGMDYPALVEEVAAVEPGAEGLVMLPHLCGAFGSEPDSHAKGAFLGITLNHGRRHFVRAILESIAFLLRENLEGLESLGVNVSEIRALGGGARSDLWLQIKAAVCQKEILALECEEATGLGTAMISFVGNGTYPSLKKACANMVRVGQRVSVRQEEVKRYDDLYHQYQNLNRTWKGTW